MMSPDNSDVRVIPIEHQSAASDAGWQPATKMVHVTTGDSRWVPSNHVAAARQVGYADVNVPAALEESHPFQGLGSAVSDTAKGLATSGVVGAAQNVYRGITEDIPAVYKAYEAARQSGASIGEAYTAANEKAKEIQNAKNGLMQAVKEFNTNPNKAAWNTVLQLGMIALGGEAMGAEAPEAEATEMTVTKPSLVQQVIKGERIAQPQAEEALRTGAEAGSKEAGVNAARPTSLRRTLESPIEQLDSQAKAAYRQIDDAAGTDFKALNEKLENTEYQIRQLTGTEEDQALEAKLEKSRTALMDKIEQAKQEAIKNGVDPKTLDEADSKFLQARAMKDVEAKVFKNPTIVKGNLTHGTAETVDVNGAVKALQRLQDTEKYGAPRLEQAFGKEGAKALLDDMYAAQRAGVKAMTRQEWAKRAVKALTGAGGAYELWHVLNGLTSGK
ncbi:MAG: hypothetical protein WCC04_02030 [Terriglobales bacterium]